VIEKGFSFNKKCVLTLVLAVALTFAAASAMAKPWKFGVMGDTQWTCPTDPKGNDPHSVPDSIIEQINPRFISAGVEFVIQVGDLTDNGSDDAIIARAVAARSLLDAGIGFFPMRGNHETYGKPANDYAIPAFRQSFPQTKNGVFKKSDGTKFHVGSNFSSPTAIGKDLDGMSYSFDFGPRGDRVRFVIIDNWATPDKHVSAAGYEYGYSIGEQQPWITGRLDKKTRHTGHALVLSHQPLIAEDHQDSPFTGYTNANPDMQNAFFAGLRDNDVKYYICGHDHMHQRSLIASPDGASSVHELICASDSSKFYSPKPLDSANWFGQKVRETSIAQDRARVGYYIFTVDGPRVTVDYYADTAGNWQSDSSYPIGPSGAGSHITPLLNFEKRETWGFSLNGKEVLVPQGGSYALTDDTSKAISNGEKGYTRTTARILGGTNTSTMTDGSLITTGGSTYRQLTKTVDTGWSPRSANGSAIASDVLTLWGMADVGGSQAETYVLSMSYDKSVKSERILGLVSMDASGAWVNAADKNAGGAKTFVSGPWNSSYGLGTYGVDPGSHTAWAVVNYTGDFAVGRK
jgi:hypothetical protein